MRLLETFGPDAILEPFVFRRGRIRARLLVPKHVDTQRALLSLQEIQRNSGFHDFRVVRVTSLHAERYVDLLRRVLTPEQERLVRLAASMGYYDTPKGATLEDIAQRVGLSVSPVHKRLKTIEEILVQSHVEPSRAVANGRRRRRRAAPVELPPSSPCEVALRVRWGASQIATFTARHPGTRVLLQTLHVDEAAGQASVLLVILADERDYSQLVDEFSRRGDVLGVEPVDRDRAHCSVKFRLRLSNGTGITFPWWGEVWGQEALLRPLVFEEGECTIRFLILRPLSEADTRERVARVAKLASWDDWEWLSARAPGDGPLTTSAEPPTARQEEVLKVAHALGYYRTPRACTLEQVAATLGVSANAIHKNLSSAESKVIAGYLAAGL
jgi:predicted DNA binding protein